MLGSRLSSTQGKGAFARIDHRPITPPRGKGACYQPRTKGRGRSLRLTTTPLKGRVIANRNILYNFSNFILQKKLFSLIFTYTTNSYIHVLRIVPLLFTSFTLWYTVFIYKGRTTAIFWELSASLYSAIPANCIPTLIFPPLIFIYFLLLFPKTYPTSFA